MTETTVNISGMMCGMCEAHICDVIRARFAVRKVTASHSKGQAVILSESGLDEAALRQAIAETGYEVTAVSARPAGEKKGLFGVFESQINNLVPFDAGVSGFGSNYKAMMCKIYKAED